MSNSKSIKKFKSLSKSLSSIGGGTRWWKVKTETKDDCVLTFTKSEAGNLYLALVGEDGVDRLFVNSGASFDAIKKLSAKEGMTMSAVVCIKEPVTVDKKDFKITKKRYKLTTTYAEHKNREDQLTLLTFNAKSLSDSGSSSKKKKKKKKAKA